MKLGKIIYDNVTIIELYDLEKKDLGQTLEFFVCPTKVNRLRTNCNFELRYFLTQIRQLKMVIKCGGGQITVACILAHLGLVLGLSGKLDVGAKNV